MPPLPGQSAPLPLSQQWQAYSPFRRLLSFVQPYRLTFALGVMATLVSSGLGLVFPRLLGKLIDSSFLHVGSHNNAALNRTVLLLIGVFACSALFTSAQSYLLAKVGSSVVADLRRTLFGHLLQLSARFFGEHKTGDLTSRLTSDVATVQVVASTGLAQLASQLVTLLGALTLLFLTSVQLSLLTLALIPLIIGTAIFFGRRIRAVSRSIQDEVARANGSATEAIGGIRVVQSFTAEVLEAQRYRQGVQASYQAALRRARLQAGMSGIMSFLSFSALALVLWYGGQQVMEGAITPGHLVTFLFYAIQVAGTVAALTGVFNQFQEALGASSRIFELLDEQPEIVSASTVIAPTHITGQVDFQAVDFQYEGQKVLQGITFSAAVGQVVALVGPSGAGKSTLVNLLPRFWDVSAGRILLDGQDVRAYALEDLRAQIGVVPQETTLFSGTVAENILYGRPNASRAEVEAAANAANASEFIERLPNGYATLVGERGIKLSGGQRQRLAIARALLKDPRILILDEATSALDNESEALVQAALERLMLGRTTFVIAHRLSTVRYADLILVLEGGQIVQRGTHTDLFAAGGLYRDLYELQFREDTWKDFS